MKLLLHFQWILLLTFFTLCFLETHGRGGRGGGGRGGGGRGGGGGRSRGSGSSSYGRGRYGSSSSNQKYSGSYGSVSSESTHVSDYTTYRPRFSTRAPYTYKTRKPNRFWMTTTPATTPKPLFSIDKPPEFILPNFEHREPYERIIKFEAPDFKNLEKAKFGKNFEEPKFQLPDFYRSEPRYEPSFKFQTPSFPENPYSTNLRSSSRDRSVRPMRYPGYEDQQPAHNPFLIDTANDPFLRNFRKKRSPGNHGPSFDSPEDQLPSFAKGHASKIEKVRKK